MGTTEKEVVSSKSRKWFENSLKQNYFPFDDFFHEVSVMIDNRKEEITAGVGLTFT